MAGYFRPDALDDPEVCALTDDEHRAWMIFCIELHPRCGIFKLNLRLWSMRCRTPMAELPACLDTFERLGWIKRDGDWVWIVSYTRHQSKQQQWLGGARLEVERLISATSLAQDWLDMYGDIKVISNLKSVVKSALISGSTGQYSTGQDSTVLTSVAKPKPIKPETRPLAELEAELDPRVLKAWHDFAAMVAAQNQSGKVSPDRLAKMLAVIDERARHERLFVTQIVYGLDCATLKPAPNVNYVLAAARGHTPPDVRTADAYYAGSAEHQARKRDSIPQAQRDAETDAYYAQLDAANAVARELQ